MFGSGFGDLNSHFAKTTYKKDNALHSIGPAGSVGKQDQGFQKGFKSTAFLWKPRIALISHIS